MLTDCEYGRCNEVATLPLSVVKQGERAGLLDSEKAAVGYAESLL